MMAINDFSSVVQLAATLCIAFVAVEYVKSFVDVLCERFFKFQDFIIDSFKECRSILTDVETLNHLEPTRVGNGNTTVLIEEAKRLTEELNKEIKKEEDCKKNEVKKMCQVRSMSSLCFFLFLVSVLILLLGGVEKIHVRFSHLFLTILDVLCMLYLVIGWFIGEREKPIKFCDFSSLRHALYSFVLALFMSSILSILWYYGKVPELITIFEFEDVWVYTLVVFILFVYLNFIVFAFKIRNKAIEFKCSVNSSKNTLMDKCKQAKSKVDDLQSVSRVEANLSAD